MELSESIVFVFLSPHLSVQRAAAGGRADGVLWYIRSWQAMGCGVLEQSGVLCEESAVTDLDCTQVNQISSTLQAMIVLVEMYSTKCPLYSAIVALARGEMSNIFFECFSQQVAKVELRARG